MHQNEQPIQISLRDETPSPDPATMLRLCMIPSLSRRVIAVFLGSEVSRTTERMPEVIANMMGEGLDRFLQTLDGRVVFTTDFRESEREAELTPEFVDVEIDGVRRKLLGNGFAFVELPGERVVISFLRQYRAELPSLVLLGVQSSRDSSTFLHQWKDFVHAKNYLRGRSCLADGCLLTHARQYTWDDIVLPGPVRQAISTHVEGFLSNLARLREIKMKLRRGLIISGPPGTGKTLLGKVLSCVLNVSFIWVLPRHVACAMVFNDILELARFLSPSVVFLEDLDLFGEERESNRSMVLGELMNQLDGVNDNDGIVTIATTNRLGVIEAALRNRPGRFDRVLDLGTPGIKCRRLLLENLLAHARLDPDTVGFVTQQTCGYTGAQLEELANTLYLLAAESGSINRTIIKRAVADMATEHKSPIGFSPTPSPS